MNIQFFIPMIPPTVTAQEHRIGVNKSGKKFIYDSAEIKTAKVKLRDYLAKYIPKEKFKPPIRLMVKWLFPITANHKNGEYKTSKPDTDNLQKMLKDVMTELNFWKDDALVASEIIEKFYSEKPGIFICIQEL